MIFKKDNSPSPKKLIKAAKKGNLELANSLIENGVDVNCKDEKGWTPLMHASFMLKHEEQETGIRQVFIFFGARWFYPRDGVSST